MVDPTAVQRVGYVMVEGTTDPDERTMMRSSLFAVALHAERARSCRRDTPPGDVPPKDAKADAPKTDKDVGQGERR